MFDCDIAPPDKFAKRVSIKHDLAARQLSPQDRTVSAAGVDPVRQPPPVPLADGGRNVKACLRRRIIAARKRAICSVRVQSFHK